jgi:hypothetical protein
MACPTLKNKTETQRKSSDSTKMTNKKMAVRFFRTPPRRGLCWDENSKDHGGQTVQFRPDKIRPDIFMKTGRRMAVRRTLYE